MTHADKKILFRYTAGFVLAVALTVTAYVVTTQGFLSGMTLAIGIMALAAAQMVIQLVVFLHIGSDKSGLNLMSFLFTGLTLLILVVGSLWIMHHLNYNMEMTPEQMD